MPVVIDAGDGGRRKPRRGRGRTDPPPIPEIPAPPQLPAPTRGRGRVPLPSTGPAPTPVIQYQDIADAQRLLREPIVRRLPVAGPARLQVLRRTLAEPQFPRLPIAGPGGFALQEGEFPSAAPSRLELGAPPTQQASPTTGKTYNQIVQEQLEWAQNYQDPLNTIEAAAGNVFTYLQFGSRPPFIMSEVQDYFGWTDEELEDAGYVKGKYGWIRAETGAPASTGAGGGAAGGGGGVIRVSRAGGGGAARQNRNALINWRI